MIIVLDSSAWFEYFNGSTAGEVVRDYLGRADELITPASVIAEVVQAARLRGGNSNEFVEFLQSKSRIEPLTPEIARRAGKLMAQRHGARWRAREAFVLATAQHFRAKVLSLNPNLEGLEDIVPLG